MKRITIIKIHLYLAGISLIFMSLMTLSGALHLFMGDEAESVSTVKIIPLTQDLNKDQLTELFKSELKNIDKDYGHSYIKGSDKSQMSRPTNRTFYTIKVTHDEIKIAKHIPSLRKSLMEFHKGHGARSSRSFMGILGFIVLGTIISGFWLGWSTKGYRKTTVITALSGAAIYLVLFLL